MEGGRRLKERRARYGVIHDTSRGVPIFYRGATIEEPTYVTRLETSREEEQLYNLIDRKNLEELKKIIPNIPVDLLNRGLEYYINNYAIEKIYDEGIEQLFNNTIEQIDHLRIRSIRGRIVKQIDMMKTIVYLKILWHRDEQEITIPENIKTEYPLFEPLVMEIQAVVKQMTFDKKNGSYVSGRVDNIIYVDDISVDIIRSRRQRRKLIEYKVLLTNQREIVEFTEGDIIYTDFGAIGYVTRKQVGMHYLFIVMNNDDVDEVTIELSDMLLFVKIGEIRTYLNMVRGMVSLQDTIYDKELKKRYSEQQVPMLIDDSNEIASDIFNKPLPRLALVQGPPGTGKSTAIVKIVNEMMIHNMVREELREKSRMNMKKLDKLREQQRHMEMWGVKNYPQKYRDNLLKEIVDAREELIHEWDIPDKRRIIICTSTNQAIDELALKLINANVKNLVRIGKRDKIHDLVKPYDMNILVKDVLEPDTGVSMASRIERARYTVLMWSDVVCMTFGSYRSWLNKNPYFTMAIVDEASHVMEPEIMPILNLQNLRSCFLFGDPKQLRPTIISDEARERKLDISLMERLMTSNNYPYMMLSTQYRMKPEILEIPNKLFYDGRIESSIDSGIGILDNYEVNNRTLFFNVCGGSDKFVGTSRVNEVEADAIVRVLTKFVMEHFADVYRLLRIGIISFYSAQMELIKEKIENDTNNLSDTATFEIGTADSFQGSEFDVVFVSCVRTRGKMMDFLDDPHRINVALTRARSICWVFGNRKFLEEKTKVWKSYLDLLPEGNKG